MTGGDASPPVVVTVNGLPCSDVTADLAMAVCGLPRLYRGVVWADVVADIAADAAVAS